MATYRAVAGLHATNCETLCGWYVERSEHGQDPLVVSPLLETKAEAETQAKRRNEEESGPFQSGSAWAGGGKCAIMACSIVDRLVDILRLAQWSEFRFATDQVLSSTKGCSAVAAGSAFLVWDALMAKVR